MSVSSKFEKTPKAVSTDVWRRNIAARLAANEGLRRRVLADVLEALNDLSEHFIWSEAYVFGSVTRPGHFTPSSDVDVAIGGLDRREHFRFLAELSGKIEREVDVVLLEECRFSGAVRGRGIRWKKGVYEAF